MALFSSQNDSPVNFSVTGKNSGEAKLFQGYDANTEFKERGDILSNLRHADETMSGKSLIATLLDSVGDFMSRALEGLSNNNGSGGANIGDSSGNVFNFESSGPIVPEAFPFTGTDLALEDGNGGNSSAAGALLDSAAANGVLSDAAAFGSLSLSGGGGGGGGPRTPPENPIPNPNPDPDDELDPPGLSASAPAGQENQPVPLNITVTPDPDATNTIVIISDVPTGATLSAGTHNTDGTWTLTLSQLSGLTMTPPAGFSGNIELTVTAISTMGNDQVSAQDDLDVVVNGVASLPLLSTDPASGAEDTPIPLDITAALTDTDGSETLSITISDVPLGATLSAGINQGNGVWLLTPGQLNGLTITPPLHFSGDIELTVTATSSENGTTASVSEDLDITVTGVATAPVLAVTDTSGAEDTAIALNIQANLADPDSETLSIVISNVPAGAVMSAGTDNHNGTWTLTGSELAGLTITPPANWSGDINLTVTAISSENGTTAQTQDNVQVTVNGVADTPSLSVQAASGTENNPVALTISAALTDTDGSESLSIIIGGVPAGASLSAGTDQGNGNWLLTPGQLSGLNFIPANDASGTFNLNVTAVASENGTSAFSSAQLTVTVTGEASTPVLSVQAASGDEDIAIPLSISVSSGDGDGSEVLSITISGVPAGASLSAGTNQGNGTWLLNPGQLNGLNLIPASNASGSFNLTVTATASEAGTSESTSSQLSVTVNGVADAPSLSVQAASGTEDNPVPLTISASLVDNDGSESLTIQISNLPAGASLSAGINQGNGTWLLSPGQLTNLNLIPPLHWSGTLQLNVTAISNEGSTTATTHDFLSVTVSGAATPPSLTVSDTTGAEDTSIALNIQAALVDPDSETLTIIIDNVPTGAVLSAGTDNGDGSWTLDASDLAGLTITPPANWSGELDLVVTAIATENGHSAQTQSILHLDITGVADTPLLDVDLAYGDENKPIDLDISASLTDTDGSETLTITISGVPAGASLSAGTNQGNGTWLLMPAQLNNLQLIPAHDMNGSFTLTVTATASEDGTTAQDSSPLIVIIHGTADTPSLSCSPASGVENMPINLNIAAQLGGTDNSEELSIVISGVPDGAQLSAGLYAGNGTWTLSPADLVGLQLIPPAYFSGSLNLSVTAVATENDGDSVSVNASLQVTIAADAGDPGLIVGAAVGVEDTAITLSISTHLLDLDGSESCVITIGNVPAGATLSAGTLNPNGTWTLSVGQLTGLTITPAHNSSVDFNLSITATVTDGSDTTSSTVNLPVTVIGDADVPLVSTSNTAGAINTQVAVNISGTLTDTDGSETRTYIIDGVPDGFALNHGHNNGDNSWTLTQAQLSGLTLISPYNFEGRVHLTAITVSHEADGDVAQSAPASFNIGVGNANGGLQINLGLGIGIGGIGLGTGVGIGVNLGSLLNANGLVVMEDSVLPLVDASGLLNLAAGISLLTFSGLPVGAGLSAGTNLGNGVWQLLPGQLTGLNLLTAPNSDQDYTITIGATLLGIVHLQLNVINVHVIGVADLPTLNVANASGNEDSAGIPIVITSALTDTDGSETLMITLNNLPAGFIPNVGINNGDGTWSIAASDLANLAITPAAGFSGDATFTVTATSTEREGDSTINTATGHIHVNPVADAPLISTTPVHGNEDQAIPLHLQIALGDTDGSEHLASVTLSGLPAGATLSHATDNHDGTWSVNPANAHLVTLTPPQHWNGDFNLHISAVSAESVGGSQATANANIAVHVDAVADQPNLVAHNISGDSGAAIAMDISASLVDTDGSESLSVVISGLPDDVYLSAGLQMGTAAGR